MKSGRWPYTPDWRHGLLYAQAAPRCRARCQRSKLPCRGIEPDIVYGTSIGALVGGAYVGGWIDPLEAWARELTRVGLARLLDIQLGHGGLIAGRRIVNIFDDGKTERLIQNLPKPLRLSVHGSGYRPRSMVGAGQLAGQGPGGHAKAAR